MRKETKKLRSKDIKELTKEISEINREIAKLKLESKVNPGKDSNLIFKKRKRLAVILTAITDKKQSEK